MVEGGRRVEIDALSKWGQTYLMGQIGYQRIPKLSDTTDQLSFIRPISDNGQYPRFHLHTMRREGRYNVELHIDRKEHLSTSTDERAIVELERISGFFSDFARKMYGASPTYEMFLSAFKRDLLFGVAERTPIPLRTIHLDRLIISQRGSRRKARSPRTNYPLQRDFEDY